jgi:fibronectin type 3 domain-containing protein
MITLLFLLFQLVSPIGNVKAADNGVLLPPSNLAYQATTPDDGKLVWSSVYGATGYNVYQITDGQLIFLGTAKTNSYSMSNLAEGKYTYVVSTLSADGESGPCAPVDVNIAYPTMAAPSSLTNTIQNGNDIVLSWGASQYAEKYNVYQIAGDGTKNLLTSTASRTYTIAKADEGKYSFAVSAVNTLYGESEVTTPNNVNIVFPVINAPANLTFNITNGSDVNLKWSAASYANSYKVYQIVDGQEVFKTSVTTTTAKLTNLPEGDYVFKVYSDSDRFGTSANGSQISVTVSPVTMFPPSSVTYKIQNINDVVLSWGASAYATAYNVYQIINGEEVLKGTYTGTSVTFTNQPGGDYTYKVYSYSDRFGESDTGTPIILSVSTVTMVPPNNVTYSIQNLNDIALSWETAPYAESYKIYQIIDGQRVLKSTVKSTNALFTNMPAGDYVYEITAYSSRFGESETGSKVSLTLDPVIMDKPTNFTYQIQNGNDISMSWDAADNATNYKVYQVVNGQKVLKNTVTGTSVTFTNMPAGDYSYQVYSYNSRFGESAEGAAVSFTLVFPSIAPPANVTSDITTPTAFTLSWDASAYATSYKVYQIANGTKTLKNTVSGTSISYSSLSPGNYVYEIHSYSSRFGESKDGSTISVSLTGQAMGTPTNLTYTILNGNDIKLTWTPVQYATNYKIYKVIDGFKILQNTITGTSITYLNLPAGDYDYVVDSYYSLLGESPVGAELQFTLVYPNMDKPANLTGSVQNTSDIVLKWDSVQYATSYKVYELIDGQEVLVKTVTSTSTTLSKVTEGTHTYVVNSVSSRFGESQEGSTSSEFTIIFPELQAPTNLTSTIVNGNDITLKWSSATYATSYNIYQIVDGQKLFVKTVYGTSNTFTNMPEGDYSYKVYTVSDRFGESADGSSTSLYLTFPTMQAPSSFNQTILNGNDIKLSWGAASYATAYKVYRVANGDKTLIKTVTGTTVTLINMPEDDYTYEVHSYSDRFGESPDGSNVSFNLVFPIMQAPSNFSYSIVNGNDISLKWSASIFATAYKVYKVVDGDRTLIKTVTGTSTSLTNMPEGDYIYEVYSYSDRFGESPIGSTVSFNLTWPVVQPPALQGTIFNANNVTLSWNSVAWANEYRVYEVTGDTKTLLYKGTALSYKVYNLTEETHSYQVTAYNTRFGESDYSNTAEEVIVYPDMQAPTANVKVTSPTSALISWSFATYANGYNVYEIVDGLPVLVAKNVNNLSYTVSNLSYKNHEFYVTSYSNSFGESGPSNTVLAKLITDTLPPVTTTNAVSDWTNKSQTVTLTATDNDTGVAKTYYSLNDGPFTEGSSVTVEKEGINKLSFYSVDKVGNTESVKTVEVKIDQTAPVTALDQNPGDFTQSYTGNLVATDTDSGVDKTYYSINGEDFVEGTTFTVDKEGVNQLSFYTVDKVGNKETAKTVEVKIDKTAPETSSDAPTSWINKEVQVNLTASDSQSGVAHTYYSINGSEYVEGTTFTVDQEGVNQVSFYTVDNAGNKEETKTVEVKVDKAAPETNSDAPTDWVNGEVQVNLTANDNQSGIAQTYYSINGSEYVEGTTFTVDQEGVNQVSFYSVDKAGNKEAAKVVEVKIDNTAPETQSDAPYTWVVGDVQLNLTAADRESGVAKTYYSINGSEYVEGTTFTVDQEGVNQVSFYSVDKAGNKENPKTVEVKIDKTSPVITSNFKDLYELESTLNLNYSTNDELSGVVSEAVILTAPGEVFGKVVNKLNQITLDKPGVYTLTIFATDAAGNTQILKKQFTVYISASIAVTPNVIKVNKGVFTLRVDLPEGFDTKQLDLNTAKLNGVAALNSNNGYYNQAKLGQFKFERSDFQWNSGEQALEFRCYVNGYLVIGQTTVKVIN